MSGENWYDDTAPSRDAAAKRDAKIASSYKQDDLMDRIERMNIEHPEKVTPSQRIAVGHYQAAREAAQRAHGGVA